MKALSEFIKKRISCRTYAERPLEDKVLRELSGYISAAQKGPFGNQPNFKLINMAVIERRGNGKKWARTALLKTPAIF